MNKKNEELLREMAIEIAKSLKEDDNDKSESQD